jgi:hypothetical protein
MLLTTGGCVYTRSPWFPRDFLGGGSLSLPDAIARIFGMIGLICTQSTFHDFAVDFRVTF